MSRKHCVHCGCHMAKNPADPIGREVWGTQGQAVEATPWGSFPPSFSTASAVAGLWLCVSIFSHKRGVRALGSLVWCLRPSCSLHTDIFNRQLYLHCIFRL